MRPADETGTAEGKAGALVVGAADVTETVGRWAEYWPKILGTSGGLAVWNSVIPLMNSCQGRAARADCVLEGEGGRVLELIASSDATGRAPELATVSKRPRTLAGLSDLDLLARFVLRVLIGRRSASETADAEPKGVENISSASKKAGDKGLCS